MGRRSVGFGWVLIVGLTTQGVAQTQTAGMTAGPACGRVDATVFETGVWQWVAVPSCLACHQTGGKAEKTRLLLVDPRKALGADRDAAMRRNREAFSAMARIRESAGSRLLLKASGELDHEGGPILIVGSKGFRLLDEFARDAEAPTTNAPATVDARPFFEGLAMLDASRLLRRATLSLAGRLPTEAERGEVVRSGDDALPKLLDAMMCEEAFFDRIREGFNDVFLTLGIDGNAEATVLSYEHFEKTRLWTQNHDLSGVPEKDRLKARYKLNDDYRKALLDEPMRLIEYIVRNDRPFTEIVTADYVMMSPYTARGYGMFDDVRTRFKNVDDPFEYIPVRLKALKGRSRSTDQESSTRFYPHAGLLGSFQYLRRYPTTETNRNRLRARMFYLHFLGIDALELAARVSDAAAVTAKYPIPTMQAAECVVCHKSLDPVAGLFQDFYSFDGVYGRRKGGWYEDMFAAGFEGDALPASERPRALQWLGERTAADPRFAVAMVEHVYYLLTGRKVLVAPKDLDDPRHDSRLRAHREQRKTIEAIAARFAKNGFNLKSVFEDWILSDAYRVDGPAVALSDPSRRAELEDVGVVRMLAPEQLERKVSAVFGKRWNRLDDQLAILYGGIDSQEVTERAADPGGAMGAIQRTMSNDVACLHTLRDFTLKPEQRLLFPAIEPDVVPGSSPEANRATRDAIVHLHERILGRIDGVDSDEVTRTFDLLAGIVAEAEGRKGLDRREAYPCRANVPDAPDDPRYTIRAWRAVVTYLLRRPEFLYE